MRLEKIQLVNDIGKLLNETDYVFLISYKGLNVEEFSSFRSMLSDCESECHVLKNRLIKKAAELHGVPEITKLDLSGDSALITGKGDPGAIAKVIDKFSKSHEQVIAKGGFIDGNLLAKEDVKAIATLPSREVILAQLVGLIQAPTRNLVTVLNAKVSSIVNVINAYKNKLEDSN